MRLISIENLLIWAFTSELPKVWAGVSGIPGFSPSDVMVQMMELGTSIDKSPNGFGVVSGYIYEGEPHPDALIVGQVVKQLADRDGFEVGDGWRPFPEWEDPHGLISAQVAQVVAAEIGRGGRMNGKQVVNLVTSAAIMKRGPDWRAEEPKAIVMKANGRDSSWYIKKSKINRRSGVLQDYEEDGFDHKARRPKPGAYQKFRLNRAIRADIVARLEWQVWQSALEILAEALKGRLSDHEIAPFRPNRAPWLASQRTIETLDRV
jgi:hypothetical protein